MLLVRKELALLSLCAGEWLIPSEADWEDAAQGWSLYDTRPSASVHLFNAWTLPAKRNNTAAQADIAVFHDDFFMTVSLFGTCSPYSQ
ncbi:hypothetical protein GCM10027343_01420 [Noviherbaspirillum agri]